MTDPSRRPKSMFGGRRESGRETMRFDESTPDRGPAFFSVMCTAMIALE